MADPTSPPTSAGEGGWMRPGTRPTFVGKTPALTLRKEGSSGSLLSQQRSASPSLGASSSSQSPLATPFSSRESPPPLNLSPLTSSVSAPNITLTPDGRTNVSPQSHSPPSSPAQSRARPDTSLRTAVLTKKVEDSESPRGKDKSLFRKESHVRSGSISVISSTHTEEPEHVRRIRNEVKKDVFFLIQEKKLANLEEPTLFFMKENANNNNTTTTTSNKAPEGGRPVILRLQKNHQVLQLTEPDVADEQGEPRERVMQRLLVTDIASVENVSKRESVALKRKNTSMTIANSPPDDGGAGGLYTIRFLRRADRENIELSTESEQEHERWLEGLEALIGAVSSNTHSDTISMMKMLTEIELEYRMLQHEPGWDKPPPVPTPPTHHKFIDAHVQDGGEEPTQDGQARKHWRCIFHFN